MSDTSRRTSKPRRLTRAELLAVAKRRQKEIDLDGSNDAALAGSADWLRAAWPTGRINLSPLPACLCDEWLPRVPIFDGERLKGLNPADVRNAYDVFMAMLTTPAEQAGKPVARTRKRRRQSEPRIVPLTPAQTEAVHLVGEHKGNITAAARAAGRTRQRMGVLYKAAMKKMGKSAVRERKKTRALPTDRRGQERVESPAN
jgi:hypothetical protein